MLTRLAFRRDRLRFLLFLALFGAQSAASYTATVDLYAGSGQAGAVTLWNSSPALVAMFGPIYDPNSIGALATIKLVGFYAAVIAVILVFHVVRHTRADEDAGRVELVSSGSVGRLAPLAAALISGAALAVGIGLASAGAMIAVGADPVGSLAFGLAWTSAGLVAVGATAVVAQVAREARPAIGLGVTLVMAAYALRAVGDLADPPPGFASWLSPIGWSQQIRPYAGDRFGVALLSLAVAVGLSVLAIVLRRRRDLGAGMLPERPGPVSTSVRSPLGLAWRLNRGLIAGWAVGVSLFGLVIGSLTDSIGGFFTGSAMTDLIKELGGQEVLTDAFLSAELTIMDVIVAGVGIALVNHLAREETSGRAELALAGPTSRMSWLAATTVVALGAVAGLTLLAGLMVGLGSAVSTGDWSYVGLMIGAAATKVPAGWVVTGIAVAVLGVAPKYVPAVWGYLLAALIVGEFADLWGLPDWVAGLSPFHFSPPMPGGEVDPVALVGLLAVAAALIGAGMAAWRRRDVH
jgi:ABC-2 type transport system permease protein